MFREASQVKVSTVDWDVSSVTDMSYMFYKAPLANPDMSLWDMSSMTSASFRMSFVGSGFDSDNYANFLEQLEQFIPESANQLDVDGDGIVETDEEAGCSLLEDCDGDGHNDNVDALPVDDTEHLDTDTDGVGDNGDNCPSDANGDQQDTDEDEVGDVCDDDDDGDTIADALDVFDGHDCSLKRDCDGDGVNDNEDAFPVDATETA